MLVCQNKNHYWSGKETVLLPVFKKKGFIKYFDNKSKLVEIKLLEVLRTGSCINKGISEGNFLIIRT